MSNNINFAEKSCQQCRVSFPSAALKKVKTQSGIVRLMCLSCLIRYVANGAGRGKPRGL